MEIVKSYEPEEITKKLKEKSGSDGLSCVISGASISYNRYDFDPTARRNAYECYPGMPSWSFMLRDAIKQNDEDYLLAGEITYTGSSPFIGMDMVKAEDEAQKYAAMNHGKISGFEVERGSSIKIKYSFKNPVRNRIVLSLQKRPDMYVDGFDIYLNGQMMYKNISNKGNPGLFRGYEPFEIIFNDLQPLVEHEIEIKDIKCSGKMIINIQAVGSKKADVYLTGCGNQTTDFFVENLDERILRFRPDLLIFTTGANDRARISVEKFKNNLEHIISGILNSTPSCDMIMMGAPYSENYTDEHRNSFLNALRGICVKYGLVFLNPEEIFKDYEVAKWRFDNVHLTKFGNSILSNHIAGLLFDDKSFHKREFIDSELWFE